MLLPWLERLGSLFLRRRLERELDDDIRSHIEIATDENLSKGMSVEEARREARRRFGNRALMKEAYREQMGVPWLDGLGREIRLALRSLAKRPGFALTVILALGLGIGTNTAIFSLVDATLIRPLPYPEADRLATVWEDFTSLGAPRAETSPDTYRDWKEQSKSFEDLAGYVWTPFNLTGEGSPERLEGVRTTPNLFSTLKVEPMLGRWFLESEGSVGETGAVIISHELWERRFGRDPGLIGRPILLNDEPHVVVGVMPPGFQYPQEGTNIWVAYTPPLGQRNSYETQVVGRLRPGVSIRQAEDEMDAIAARVRAAHPEKTPDDGASLLGLREDLVGDSSLSLWLLLGSSLLVLLAACSNVAGLLITRGIGRTREIAVRTALGAGRAQIARHLLIEGLTLSGAGGVVGLLLAAGTLRYLEALTPAKLLGATSPSLDLRVLGFTIGVSIVTGVVFGLAPLGRALRPNLGPDLRARGTGRPNGRFQTSLVSAQVAIALVVVSSTGLLLRTMVNLAAVDPGFARSGVLTARIEVSDPDGTVGARNGFYEEIVENVEALPGVRSAGFTTFLPYTSGGIFGSSSVDLEERPDLSDDFAARLFYWREVTPGYLPSIEADLVAGRWFNEGDGPDAPQVAIVTEEVAELLGGDAVGKRIRFTSSDVEAPPWRTIVGVIAGIRREELAAPSRRATVYRPFAQSPELGFLSPRDLVVRVEGDALALAPAIREIVWALDPDQTISDVRTIETILDSQTAPERTRTTLFLIFSGLVLSLASLGVYGLMSFVVASRAHDFGVRIALGAERKDLALLVARQGIAWLGAGLFAGLALTLVVSESLRSLLYEVQPLDGWSLAVSILVLCGAGVLAAWVPLRRATHLDPMSVLQSE